MLGPFWERNGRYSGLAAGLGCLALGGFMLLVPLPWPTPALLSLAFVGVGVWRIARWSAARRAAKYDLSRLFEDEPASEGEPYDDTVETESAPYCGWCDEALPLGVYKCPHCGRPVS